MWEDKNINLLKVLISKSIFFLNCKVSNINTAYAVTKYNYFK